MLHEDCTPSRPSPRTPAAYQGSTGPECRRCDKACKTKPNGKGGTYKAGRYLLQLAQPGTRGDMDYHRELVGGEGARGRVEGGVADLGARTGAHGHAHLLRPARQRVTGTNRIIHQEVTCTSTGCTSTGCSAHQRAACARERQNKQMQKCTCSVLFSFLCHVSDAFRDPGAGKSSQQGWGQLLGPLPGQQSRGVIHNTHTLRTQPTGSVTHAHTLHFTTHLAPTLVSLWCSLWYLQ